MHALDPLPSVRRIETKSDRVLALEIDGELKPADVENLFGLLDGAYELHEKIDVLVRLANFEGIDWNGISKESTDEGKRRAKQHIRRVAAVGEKGVTSIGKFLAPSSSVEFQHFSHDREPEAWDWIGTREIPLE